MKQKHDVAIKNMPIILDSVEKVSARWLEEMLPLDTVLITICLELVLSSGQQVL